MSCCVSGTNIDDEDDDDGDEKKMYQQWRHYNGITPSKNVLFAYTIVMNRTHINISIESIRWPVCTLNDIVNTHSIHLNN